MLNALIVDDEAPARAELGELLKASGEVCIVGECANAIEALGAIHRLRPDAVFLDIQMPRISGLELVGMLEPECIPHIIFVTAYDEFALQAFNEQAIDYLLKPVDPIRLAKTLARVRQMGGAPAVARVLADTVAELRQIPCIGHNRVFLLPVDEVEYLCSDAAGVRVFAANQCGVTELALKIIENRTRFLRCHRQYLVNPDRIAELVFAEGGACEIHTRGGQRVPVSRRHLRALKDFLSLP
jgi:two-component system, LytTR family, response regulator